ncbi:hypothetical protein R83H12_02772 [Fibrobacteria bacterium R8-3-H12]
MFAVLVMVAPFLRYMMYEVVDDIFPARVIGPQAGNVAEPSKMMYSLFIFSVSPLPNRIVAPAPLACVLMLFMACRMLMWFPLPLVIV